MGLQTDLRVAMELGCAVVEGDGGIGQGGISTGVRMEAMEFFFCGMIGEMKTVQLFRCSRCGKREGGEAGCGHLPEGTVPS